MRDDRPWLTALEMQFAALRAARVIEAHPGVLHDARQEAVAADVKGLVDTDDTLAALVHHAATGLPLAVPYAWARDPTQAVLAVARTVPLETRLTLDLLPSRVSWWWFEEPIALLAGASQGHDGHLIHAVQVAVTQVEPDHRLGLDFTTFTLSAGPAPLPVCSWFAPVDSTLADLAQVVEQHGDALLKFHALHTTQFVVAGALWLQQRILALDSGAIERHQRKQIAREHGVPLPADVKVVSLRALESSQAHGPLDDPHDWSCRWVVRGHWRMQPYKDRVAPRFIMPHVKGPADKPLRVPAQTVFSVHR